MVRRLDREIKKEVRGGRGEVYFYPVLTPEELMGHGRMYAKVVLPAGSSIGVHVHEHETEPYYILEGEADFIEPDGSVSHVCAGDSCTIDPGQSHGIENNSDKDCVFMALIYND